MDFAGGAGIISAGGTIEARLGALSGTASGTAAKRGEAGFADGFLVSVWGSVSVVVILCGGSAEGLGFGSADYCNYSLDFVDGGSVESEVLAGFGDYCSGGGSGDSEFAA